MTNLVSRTFVLIVAVAAAFPSIGLPPAYFKAYSPANHTTTVLGETAVDPEQLSRALRWSIRYNDGSNHNNLNAARPTSDGGFVIAAVTTQGGNGPNNGAVLKIDEKGIPQWNRVFSPVSTNYDYLRTIAETRDGGFIAAGMTWRFPDSGHDTWVIKLNANGVPLWERAYRLYGTIYRYTMIYDIVETRDGGFLLAGYGYQGSSRDAAFIVKLRSDGSVVWHKLWGNAYSSEYAHSVTELRDGNIVVVGAADNTSFVTMLRPDGSTLWQNKYASSFNTIYAVTETPDGALAVAGAVFNLEYDPQYGYIRRVAWDAMMMKLDQADGGIVWQRTYGGSGYEKIDAIKQITSDRLLVAGSTDSFGNGSTDLWLAEINASNGSIVWEKSYGSQAAESVASLSIANVNTITLAGTIYDHNLARSDLWVLNVDRAGRCTICGELENTTTMPLTNRTLSVGSFATSQPSTTIYPMTFSSAGYSPTVSMRLACPVALDVGLFLQNSPRWGDNPYGSLPNAAGATIGALGCYMTSAAMIVNYFAEQQEVSFRTDPGLLNQWLRSNNKYLGLNFDHPTGAEYAKLFGVEMYSPSSPMLNGPNDDLIRSRLQSGKPVIIRIPTDASVSEVHFVVVIGETEIDEVKTFIISDPIEGYTTLQAGYGTEYNSIRLYDTEMPNDLRSIMISAHSPVEIVVEDALGRRSGYDPTTGVAWNQIPGATYYTETISLPGGGSGIPETEEKFLHIPSPLNDEYLVYVYGTASGEYQINARASNFNGRTSKVTHQGYAHNGSMDVITVTYDSSNGWSGLHENYLPLIVVRR